jgi:hypothetical protein
MATCGDADRPILYRLSTTELVEWVRKRTGLEIMLATSFVVAIQRHARGKASRRRTAAWASERAAQWPTVVPMQHAWLDRELIRDSSPEGLSPVDTAASAPVTPARKHGADAEATSHGRPLQSRQNSFERLRRRAQSLAQSTGRAAANAAAAQTAAAAFLRRRSTGMLEGSAARWTALGTAPSNAAAISRARRLSV